jgi:hypothetical protein
MQMKRQCVVAGAVAIGLLSATVPGRATALVAQRPENVERCKQILKMLIGEGTPGEGLGQMRRSNRSWVYEGGEIAKVQAQLKTAEDALRANPSDRARQAEVERLKGEQNRVAGLINRFTDQLTELQCPGAPPKVEDLGSTGGGVTPPETPPTPPGGRGTTPPRDGRGGRGAAPIDADNWRGDWTHDYGTLSLKPNADRAGTRDLVVAVNSWGPASNCPEDALVLGGEITWKSLSWGQDEITAPVVACAVGGVLEGKFDNSGRLTAAEAGQGRIRVGYFKLTLSKPGDRYMFHGDMLRWNHIAKSPLNGFNTFVTGRK